MTEDEIEAEAIRELIFMTRFKGVVVVQETMTSHYRTMPAAELLDRIAPSWRLMKLGSESLCAVHRQWEALPPQGAFRVCVTCRHVWATRLDLALAWNRLHMTYAMSAAKAHTIYYCPACTMPLTL